MVLEVVVKGQMDLLVELQDRDQALNQLRKEIRLGPKRIEKLGRQVETLEEDLEVYKGRIQDIPVSYTHLTLPTN